MSIDDSTNAAIAERVAQCSSDVLKLLTANGLTIGAIEAQALILAAFGVLIAIGASHDAVADYCQAMWESLEMQFKSRALLALPMPSAAVNG